MALVVLNFKAYAESIGENAIKLANIAKEVSQETGIEIWISPQAVDILKTAPTTKTIAQHVCPQEPGAGTGSTLAEAVKQAGAIGSLLNHSEKRLNLEQIKFGVNKLKELGMTSIVCSPDPETSKEIAPLNPDYIAVEPPELIGTGVSVSKAKPEVVTNSIKAISEINSNVKVLCGAGISNGGDVKKAIELGVEGVLLASAFTKAQDPKAVLQDICGGFK